MQQASPPLVIHEIHDVTEVERVLTPPVLRRLKARGMAGARRGDLAQSHVIVALVSDVVIGFVAYKVARGPVRVAHEFVVDRESPIAVADVTSALACGFEAAVRAEDGSRVVAVIQPTMKGRASLEQAGYRVTLVGPDSVWLEKGLIESENPLPSG